MIKGMPAFYRPPPLPAHTSAMRDTVSPHPTARENAMSKGLDKKKETKKKPEKSLKEKRAAKQEKKSGK
ncbi:hypothetical protein GCM10027432_13150 [Lysobacter fragariae]